MRVRIDLWLHKWRMHACKDGLLVVSAQIEIALCEIISLILHALNQSALWVLNCKHAVSHKEMLCLTRRRFAWGL